MAQKLKNIELIHLSGKVIRSLSQNRIANILEFLQEDVNKLSTVTNLSLPQILEVRNDILSKFSAPLSNGIAVLEKIQFTKRYISTGIQRVDALLNGGIPTGFITEIVGLADSGKTQFCLQLAVNCAKNSNTVLYVDTKGDFSAVRVQKMLDAAGYSHKEMAEIMYRIKVIRIWTIEELIELFQNIKKNSVEFKNLALIIIDSLPCLMLQFLGDDNKFGLKLLNTFVNYSRYLCKELQIGFLCVNIQTRWIDQDLVDLDDDGQSVSCIKEAYTEKRNRCLGKYWQHIPYLVLLLEKNQQSYENYTVIEFSVMNSCSLEAKYDKILLKISSLGVTEHNIICNKNYIRFSLDSFKTFKYFYINYF